MILCIITSGKKCCTKNLFIGKICTNNLDFKPENSVKLYS